MAGAIGGDSVAGFGRANDGCWASGEIGRRATSRDGERVRLHQRGMRKGRERTLLRNRAIVGGKVSQLHFHRAVMVAIAAAAGGKLRYSGSGHKDGRDQRKAEDEHQRRCERASHLINRSKTLGKWRVAADPSAMGVVIAPLSSPAAPGPRRRFSLRSGSGGERWNPRHPYPASRRACTGSSTGQ